MRASRTEVRLGFPLPPAAFQGVVRAPRRRGSRSRGGAASKSVDALANGSQIDRNLSLVNLARAFIAAFGFTAVLGALASEEARARLQCALAAASCLMTSMYYVGMTAVRMTPAWVQPAEQRVGGQHALFQLGGLQRPAGVAGARGAGPVQRQQELPQPHLQRVVWLGTFLCSLGVVLGGATLFCVESARMQGQSTRRRVAWACWALLSS